MRVGAESTWSLRLIGMLMLVIVSSCAEPVDWTANSAFELECEGELREYGSFDWGEGAPSIEAALTEWESAWHPSQSVLLRAKVADQVAAAVAAYTGSEGKTRYVLRLQRHDNVWVIVSSEACTPPW